MARNERTNSKGEKKKLVACRRRRNGGYWKSTETSLVEAKSGEG